MIGSGAATETEIKAATGFSSSRITPERIRMWQDGIIEPENEDGWTAALRNRPKTVRWRRVDDQDRQKEVAERAATRKTRNAKPSAEEEARRIVEALSDPTVNRLVLQLTKAGPGSRRAVREAEKVLKQQHSDARQRARQAERDKATNADFQRMIATLWDARGAVAAIDAHLIRERARVSNGEPRLIADADWLVALRDVRTIIESFGTMWKNVRDLGDADAPCPACGAPQAAEHRGLNPQIVDTSAEEFTEAEIVSEDIVDADAAAM
ncbi:hypothetical protein DVA67_017680 [Solirubrobacter sp. CPCC 204708]|nr:hypothetical protein [Solirubrobacter deserti]